jgi:hypothetical protein
MNLQPGGQRRGLHSNAGRLICLTPSGFKTHRLPSPASHGKSMRKSIRRGVGPAGILALCFMLAGAAFAQSGSHTITLTGRVSCSMCVLPNTCKAQTRMSCVSWWVNQGSSYVLVVGTRNYRLLGADEKLKGLAGRTVTVTGEQFRSDVVVATVE